MTDKLIFSEKDYVVRQVEREGVVLNYRAFENILYVGNPVADQTQRLSIYVPECYYHGETLHGYQLHDAPIFMPNTVGGYMPGPVEPPGADFRGNTNASFWALLHGYVVVSPGVRGRQMRDEDGKYIGAAPAAICDLKAAVRYLRHNKKRIPGSVERIISNGTSAGGALSSLLAATGNHPDFELDLRAMGAAEERDDIFAASCYCPITNLDHADMAYEWEYYGLNDYHRVIEERPEKDGEKPKLTKIEGEMSGIQRILSEKLKVMFPEYVNSLNLRDVEGNFLMMNADGTGSFQDYVISFVKASAQRQLDRGEDLSGMNWMKIADGKVESIDFPAYVRFKSRMKTAPAFDNVNMGTPENELFGTPEIQYRHFTAFSKEHSRVNGKMAPFHQIKQMNPMYYIRDEEADKARHVRIRHGCVDRDTSLAVSAMLHAMLTEAGVDSDLAYPWGMPHAGDYDLKELFAWIDQICSS